METFLTVTQQKLSEFMSAISEEAYTAGWMANLEYALWEAVLNGPRKYGHYFINQNDIDALVALSNTADCWIYFDSDTEEIAIPMAQWREKYNADVSCGPGLTKG